MNKKILALIFSFLLIISNNAMANLDLEIDGRVDGLYEVYRDLHRHPELSMVEKNTSEKLADELTKIGFKVTRNFGGYAVVGMLKNGEGPTIMFRTDMDALPIKEETGLDYASKVVMKDRDNQEMPVMHACGHDMHMTVWLGVAQTLFALKNQWKGTLLMIAEPGEEVGLGAGLILDKKLYQKFPLPKYVLAYHVSPEIASGKIGYKSGYLMANVDTVNIDVYGIGGHGAMPEKTIDPIVLASKIVLDLQTIISRKISPMDSAVITVGAINGGTKSNLIPDQVKLQLTIRSYEDDVRDKILDAVKKITDGNAMAAGLSKDKYPKISYLDGFVPSLYNSPDLTNKVMSSIVKSVGKENVAEAKASMVGEDFSRYGRTKENIPITMLRLGIGDPKQIAKKQTPVLHSSTVQIFSPKLVIKTGVKTMADTIMDLMKE